MGERTYRGKDE